MPDLHSDHIFSRLSKVLVIDDDPVARMTLRAILEDEGYSVTCAEDGRRGLEAFRKLSPDLVVTDIIMPEKEGIETIRELQSIWPEGPIIAISGGGRTGNTDYLRLARGMGANAVLMKPFEPAAPTWVHKRDGRTVPFEADRISRALFAAGERCGRPDAFLARELADAVVHFLADEADNKVPTTTQVREVVVKVLGGLGQHALVEAFEQFDRRRNRPGGAETRNGETESTENER